MSLTAYYAIFDSNNLAQSVTGLDILGIDSYMQPKRSLGVSTVSRADKSKVSSGFYSERYINIRLRITAPSNIELESRLDTLNSLIQGLEKELLVPQSGTTRKFTATLEDVNVTESGGAHWQGSLVFRCSNNFGYDYTYTSILNMVGTTAGVRADSYNFDGSAEFQVPHFEIYYTAVSGGTGGTVLLGNSTTGQQLTITRDFVAGDRLVVDCDTSSVTVNGANVSFTGAFPMFRKGTADITYTDDFTTRTFNYFVYYYKRWV